jgi:hypothetical protein
MGHDISALTLEKIISATAERICRHWERRHRGLRCVVNELREPEINAQLCRASQEIRSYR